MRGRRVVAAGVWSGDGMTAEQWLVAPGTSVSLSDTDAGDTGGFSDKHEAERTMDADLERLESLQEMLYADGRFAVLLILQGMDTSGKDGMVKHLSRGLTLVGAELANFKQPSAEELAHDFLWRVHARTPPRGRIGIFNRSQYEDVLVVRVHGLVPEAVWERRYEQINAFERILTENNTVVLKCFLHISEEEQRERLQARLDDPSKHWKFNPGDLKERARWKDYQHAYEDALSRCSTDAAPWYIIPADKKWHRDYAVTRVLIEALERLDLRYPAADFDPASIRIT